MYELVKLNNNLIAIYSGSILNISLLTVFFITVQQYKSNSTKVS